MACEPPSTRASDVAPGTTCALRGPVSAGVDLCAAAALTAPSWGAQGHRLAAVSMSGAPWGEWHVPRSPAAAVDTSSPPVRHTAELPRSLQRPGMMAGCAFSSAVSPAGTPEHLCLHRPRLSSLLLQTAYPQEKGNLSPRRPSTWAIFSLRDRSPLSSPHPKTLLLPGSLSRMFYQDARRSVPESHSLSTLSIR